MSNSTETLTNSSSDRVIEKRPQNRVPDDSPKEFVFGHEILKSIKSLQSEYNAQLKRRRIRRAQELRKFQLNFWKKKATDVGRENSDVYNLVERSRAKFKPNAKELCKSKMWDYYRMVHLLNADIRNAIERHSVDVSELTVLISANDIQRFRCKKYLQDWKLKTTEKSQQSPPALPNTSRHKLDELEVNKLTSKDKLEHPSRKKSNEFEVRKHTSRSRLLELETQITYHVREFLKLIYKSSKLS